LDGDLGGEGMNSKTFMIIAIICFGLVTLAWFFWALLIRIRIPDWLEDILGWTFVIGVPIGIISLVIGIVMFLMNL